MRKIVFVPACVLIFFLLEFFLFNMAGRWFMPNLLLLAIIYFNLAFGIRYSIFAAVLAGVLKDSFSTGIFGLNIFSLVLCAYMTTVLKRYLHYAASRRSRFLLVFFITVINISIHFCLQAMFEKIDVGQVFKFVFVPEVLTTLVVTSLVFTELKKCVSKLFV
jgi:rod shape-determining protein MreD